MPAADPGSVERYSGNPAEGRSCPSWAAGEEADRDSRFAEELCRELSVPFSLIYADVRGLADREGISEEEAGRILRYESFESEGKSGNQRSQGQAPPP